MACKDCKYYIPLAKTKYKYGRVEPCGYCDAPIPLNAFDAGEEPIKSPVLETEDSEFCEAFNEIANYLPTKALAETLERAKEFVEDVHGPNTYLAKMTCDSLGISDAIAYFRAVKGEPR